MESLISVFVVAHLLGLSAILGGWLANRLGAEGGLSALVWGARAQFVIGLILVGLNEAAREELNYAKIAVKAAVGLTVVILAEIANLWVKRGRSASVLVNMVAGLTIVNVAVAVGWLTAT
ncbi:hypothetical protein [Propionicimonas sp.]|uniref:hypothetical protein n=1 Tax=Propionicimonas sp. TaxID=1955623 RepID=UPI00182E2CE7|nr:hypothetical protein [Propionicimonas sp.]MBU3977553.1 hypothetical protein [Actinomycetota bacterium]MBA3021478.1 hypothetical protein [Propionicimonas sp.]MBU3987027.1 hypothetical protein [Actinomycetota bacterium]MBU4008848.1 hypothetical protein [Actinomycetota bacterium]MBU4066002.1 hypothetical protein [Actinomycetota bacterium]